MSEAAFPRPLSTLVEEEGEEDEAPPLRINFTVASMVEGEAPPTPNSAPPTPKLSLSLRAMLEEDEIEIDMETSPPRKAADGGGADAAVGRKVAVEKPEAEDRAKPARAPRQRPKQRVAAALENENIRGNNMPYEYAMVLSYGASLEDPDRGFKLQAAVMARLLRAGIQAVVLESTVLTHNRLCLLLKPTDVRLQAERLQLRLDRWFVQRGGDGELPESIIHALSDKFNNELRCPWCGKPGELRPDLGGVVCLACAHAGEGVMLLPETHADRIQLIASILARDPSHEPPGAGISIHDSPIMRQAVKTPQGTENPEDADVGDKEIDIKEIIEAVFPLHDPIFNREFLRRWTDPREHTDLADLLGAQEAVRNPAKEKISIKRRCCEKVHSACCAPVSRFITKRSITFHRLFNNKWYIEQLESHFGDQVAFFFAFSNYYTVWLIGPAVIGFFVTAIMAFGHDKYLMALAVFGLGMPAVWAPMFLKDWERRNKRLQQKWSVTSFREAVYPNKHYNPELAMKRHVFRCYNGIDASAAKSAHTPMFSSTALPHDFDETKADADEETNFVLRSGRPVQISVTNAQEAGVGGPQRWKGNSLITQAGALCDNLIETSAHFRPSESYKLFCRECGIVKTFLTAEAVVEQQVSNGLRNCCLIMWQVLAVFIAVLFEAVFIAIHVTLFVNSQSIPVCRSDQKDPFAMGITDPTNPLFFPSCDDVPYNLTKASQDKCRTATLGCFNDMWYVNIRVCVCVCVCVMGNVCLHEGIHPPASL
jgi:hypothetical protein